MAKKAGQSPKRSSPRAAARRRATSTKRQAGAARKRSARTGPRQEAPGRQNGPKSGQARKPRPKSARLRRRRPPQRPRNALKQGAKAAASKAAAPRRSRAEGRRSPGQAPSGRTPTPGGRCILCRSTATAGTCPNSKTTCPRHPRRSTSTGRRPRPAPDAWECASDRLHHTETSPELTGGDVDANWENAYAVGDERRAATTRRPIRIASTTSAKRSACSTRTTRN